MRHSSTQSDLTRWPNVGLLLGQRRRRWPNCKPALDERLMFVGIINAVHIIIIQSTTKIIIRINNMHSGLGTIIIM